jgi:D-serine deaminase-like pyridoxal phosphate-dependent protein
MIMTKRRLLAAVLMLALIVPLTACTDDNLRKLAQAGDDFSRGLTVAFDLDASLLHSGAISKDDALTITTTLLDLNKLGKTFHERLVAYSKLTPEARGALLPILAQLVAAADGLQRNGLLRIKDPKAQAEFSAAVAIITGALATAQIVLRGN